MVNTAASKQRGNARPCEPAEWKRSRPGTLSLPFDLFKNTAIDEVGMLQPWGGEMLP